MYFIKMYNDTYHTTPHQSCLDPVYGWAESHCGQSPTGHACRVTGPISEAVALDMALLTHGIVLRHSL